MRSNSFRRSLGYGFAMLAAAITVSGGVLSGCGGTHSSTPAVTNSSTGRLVLVTRWPERGATTRLIPVLTDELTFDIVAVSEGTTLASVRVPRPTSGTESTTEFPAIPAGDVEIRIRAWKNGSTVPLAFGTGQATVTAGNATQAHVSLASTITQLLLSPTTPQVRQLAQVQHSATALDAQGAIVPTATSALQWSSSASAVATINATGLLVAVGGGSTRVTVKEPESGKQAFYDLTVIPNDPTTQIPPTYVLTELSRSPQSAPVADVHAINDLGQVVGDLLFGDARQGFLWENGAYTIIPNPPGEYNSTARDINNRGQVVGGSATQGFIWERGAMTTFRVTLPVNYTIYAVRGTAINESGTVAGAVVGGDSSYVFRRTADGTISVGSNYYRPGVFRIADINESNNVITNSFGYLPVLWRADGTTVSLNTPGITSAINDAGIAVGSTASSSGLAAFWNPDQTELPGTQNGIANDINNGGLIVGYAYQSYNVNRPRAFVARIDGNPVYFNTLPIVNGTGWTFDSATGINSKGQIIGRGTKNGSQGFFLLTPKFD